MKNEFDKLNKNIDVVVAVPVCSGLSGANSTGKEEHKAGSEAVQNNNQLGILEFVISKIKPKVYIYENAPGLYTNMGTGLREKIVSVAKAAGYNIQFNKVNTINYGLPQSRQRTFCILWRKDVFATVPKFPFERLPRQTFLGLWRNIFQYKSCVGSSDLKEELKARLIFERFMNQVQFDAEDAEETLKQLEEENNAK
jgi:DNA (cytosine-5)-methyltransferase 1